MRRVGEGSDAGRDPDPGRRAPAARGRRGLLGRAEGFAARREGGVAVIFALALVPLTLAVGGAIDYSRAVDARTHLDIAADAAALSTVTPSAMARGANDAEASALDAFEKRAALVKNVKDVKPKIKVKDQQGRRTTTVTYEGKVGTTFMNLAGYRNVDIAGDATASSGLPTYIDFHLLLDNTPSMGLGATLADIDRMVNNTSDRCAFACHDLSANGNDYYALAKRLGVTLRIDVVRAATQRLMDTAKTTAQMPGQFRAAIHTFGATCTGTGLTTLSALTSNLTDARTRAADIDLMTIPYQNFNNDQCTDLDGAFLAMNQVVQAAGDGRSASSPQKVLLFVSDGVADAFYPGTCSRPTTGGRCQEPLKPADCQALKDRGVKIAVLYTTYQPLPTNSWYTTWIAPFAGTIPAKMEACASPGLFFEVSPSQGIAEAMEALFKKTVSQARLTS